MAWKNDKELKMEIDKNFDHILEEGQNTSINIRKISWGERPMKIDIRKWSYVSDKETPLKGISLSDEGADELAAVLIENGYGNTNRILEALKKREDYNKINNSHNIIEADFEDNENNYYDPKELLN